MHRVAALLACALASASISAAASAQHVRTLEPGAAVAELGFGARQWALPGGGWTLLGKQIREVRINETKGAPRRSRCLPAACATARCARRSW